MNYTLTLTDAQVNYIGMVLSEKPYKEVAEILAVMQSQVVDQNRIKTEKVESE